MDIKVFLKNGTEVIFTGVSDPRYEKSNHNNGKGNILAIYENTDPTDWGATKVVAEFHRDDIYGWAEVDHIIEIGE